MNVLVTGGAGFIGSHLVETLVVRGYKVTVLDNLVSGNPDWIHSSAKLIVGDVSNLEDCYKATEGVQGVFHLAAMSRSGPSVDNIEICTQSNVIGTQNMLIAAREFNVKKFVYSGSSTYYGSQPAPHKEALTPHDFLNAYGLTKYFGEEFCLLFDKLYDVPTIVLRYFNVYGPRQPEVGAYALVLGIFIERMKSGLPLEIHGDGAQRRDFIHVSDVVSANIAAFESEIRSRVYNVGSGINYSIKEVADLISSNQIFADRRKGDAKETLADIKSIKSDLNWNPSIDFASGLKDLVKYEK